MPFVSQALIGLYCRSKWLKSIMQHKRYVHKLGLAVFIYKNNTLFYRISLTVAQSFTHLNMTEQCFRVSKHSNSLTSFQTMQTYQLSRFSGSFIFVFQWLSWRIIWKICVNTRWITCTLGRVFPKITFYRTNISTNSSFVVQCGMYLSKRLLIKEWVQAICE